MPTSLAFRTLSEGSRCLLGSRSTWVSLTSVSVSRLTSASAHKLP
jgi:hypothetical protein